MFYDYFSHLKRVICPSSSNVCLRMFYKSTFSVECFCGNSTENKKDQHNRDIYGRCHFRRRRGRALLLTDNDNNITLVCVSPAINYVRRQINGYSSVKFNIRNHSWYELEHICFHFYHLKYNLKILQHPKNIVNRRFKIVIIDIP